MSIAYGSGGTYFTNTTGTPAFAVPSDVASGDIVVIAFFTDNAGVTISGMPSGFAHAASSPVVVSPGGGGHSLNIIWKRASAADTGTYTVTLSGSTFVEGQAHRYTGALSTDDPWESPTSIAVDATSGSSTPAVSLTTDDIDRVLVHAATCWAGGTWTASTGFTKRQQGGFGLSTLSDKAQASAGASGSVVATTTSSDKRTAWLGALIPEPVTSTITKSYIAKWDVLGTTATDGASYEIEQIMDALADIFDGVSTGDEVGGVPVTITCTADITGQFEPPAIILELDDQEFDLNMGSGADSLTITALALVQYQSMADAQRTLWRFLSRRQTSGIARLKAHLEENQTLGGLVSYAHMSMVRNIGIVTYGNVDYLGAEIVIEVVS